MKKKKILKKKKKKKNLLRTVCSDSLRIGSHCCDGKTQHKKRRYCSHIDWYRPS